MKIYTGKRPLQGKGGGLCNYIYYSIKNNIGVIGYDPVQGALSPILRFLCHCSIFLIVWGMCYRFYCSHFLYNDANGSSTMYYDDNYYIVGGIVLCLYTAIMHYIHHIVPGVSIPSGPRPHKIQRIPQWDNRNITLPSTNTNRYSTAQESHLITEQLFAGTCGTMTGEPMGRDIWTTNSTTATSGVTTCTPGKSNNKNNKQQSSTINDEMVQLLASGGRSYNGFNPHINPNR
jgi:hypothetical protein